VGRTQLSDTGVGDELTVIVQVTWGVGGQGPVDKSHNLEHYALSQEASAAGRARARYVGCDLSM